MKKTQGNNGWKLQTNLDDCTVWSLGQAWLTGLLTDTLTGSPVWPNSLQPVVSLSWRTQGSPFWFTGFLFTSGQRRKKIGCIFNAVILIIRIHDLSQKAKKWLPTPGHVFRQHSNPKGYMHLCLFFCFAYRVIRSRGRWEGGSGWRIHVNPWLIHVNVWQKPLQYCKVISLQLIKINEKKKDTCTLMFIAALFKIAKTWKKPKHLSGEQMDKDKWIYGDAYIQ